MSGGSCFLAFVMMIDSDAASLLVLDAIGVRKTFSQIVSLFIFPIVFAEPLNVIVAVMSCPVFLPSRTLFISDS